MIESDGKGETFGEWSDAQFLEMSTCETPSRSKTVFKESDVKEENKEKIVPISRKKQSIVCISLEDTVKPLIVTPGYYWRHVLPGGVTNREE